MQEKEEKRRKMVRNAQMGLWVALILVQMAVVNCLTVRAETDGGPGLAPESVAAESRGAESVAAESRGAETAAEFTVRQVHKDVVYEQVEGGAFLPETLDIQVTEDGQTVTAVCAMQEKAVLRERWDEDFSFPVTFHTYDAESYRLGDSLVACNEERPELEGCEGQLLELIGVSPEEYQVTALEWAGEPYLGEDGELCRDALGTGKKLVRDYRVRYAGEARIPVRQTAPPETETTGDSPEQTTAGEESVSETPPQVRITEESVTPPQPEPELEKPLTLWQKITRTLLIAVGIGALLFFGGLLILAFLWVVKKLKKWYTGRKR